jgi:hypothetical protein
MPTLLHAPQMEFDLSHSETDADILSHSTLVFQAISWIICTQVLWSNVESEHELPIFPYFAEQHSKGRRGSGPQN